MRRAVRIFDTFLFWGNCAGIGWYASARAWPLVASHAIAAGLIYVIILRRKADTTGQ